VNSSGTAVPQCRWIAGVEGDAMVLLNSQMAAKALLQTGVTEIIFGCPKFSLGHSASKS